MASPQCEDGFVRVAHETALAMARVNIPAQPSRVLWIIWWKTYGFSKTEDWISNSQIIHHTGMDKTNVSRALKILCGMRMIEKRGRRVRFLKNYAEWRRWDQGLRAWVRLLSAADFEQILVTMGKTPNKEDQKEIEEKLSNETTFDGKGEKLSNETTGVVLSDNESCLTRQPTKKEILTKKEENTPASRTNQNPGPKKPLKRLSGVSPFWTDQKKEEFQKADHLLKTRFRFEAHAALKKFNGAYHEEDIFETVVRLASISDQLENGQHCWAYLTSGLNARRDIRLKKKIRDRAMAAEIENEAFKKAEVKFLRGLGKGRAPRW
jgi:phage replication O-like protein O